MAEQHKDLAPVVPSLKPRDRIIYAALELVSERGLGAVSMTDLAKAAGVSRQTLYNHFSDVGSVIDDAISQHDAAALQQLTTALHVCPTPRDAVVQLVHHFAALGSQGHYYEVEHALSAASQKHIATYEDGIRQLIRDTLMKGIASGDFRADIDPPTDSALVFALLDGVTQAVAKDPTQVSTIVKSAARTIEAALGRN